MSGRGEEILGFAAQGLTDKQVAARLGISVRTVEGHWRRLRESHQLPNRSSLIAALHRTAIVEPDWYSEQIAELATRYELQARAHASEIHAEITALHQRISALQDLESEAQHLRGLLNQNQALAYRLDYRAPHACLYMSDSVEALGYAPVDFLSGRMLICNLVHPEDFSTIWRSTLRDLPNGSGQLERRYRVMTRFGEVRHLFERVTLERNSQGQPHVCSCVAFDVTHTSV